MDRVIACGRLRRCGAALAWVAATLAAASCCRTSRPATEAGEAAARDASDEALVDARPRADADAAAPACSGPAWTARVVLDRSPFPPVAGAPTAVVHAPPCFDPAPPLQLVVFLHGWTGCAAVLEGSGPTACRPGDRELEGWGLGERHDHAGTGSLLVVPQLAFMVQDGGVGRFAEEGFFGDFVDELLRERIADRLGAPRSLGDVDRVTLVAHSAGFKTALSILQRGGADAVVRDVVLFDALYAGPALFGQWVAGAPPGGAKRQLVSLYTRRGPTARLNRELGEALQARLGREAVALDPAGPLADALRERQVVIAPSEVGHGAIPARYLAEVLSALDLRRRAP